MDVFKFGVITVVVLSFCVLTHQMPQEGVVVDAPTTTETAVVEENALTVAPAINCTTSRGLNGTCIQRQSCDYSTYAIDLTLYAPRGYVRPCTKEEVCCPFDYLVRVDENQTNFNEDEFDFDNDN